MGMSVNGILVKWADQGGDVFYSRQGVLNIVNDIEKGLHQTGRVWLDRMPGNGAMMGAAIEILEGKGYEVTTKRESFNKRILEMTVIGKPEAEPEPITMNSEPKLDRETAVAIATEGARADMWFEGGKIARAVTNLEAAAARTGEAVFGKAQLRHFNGYESRAIIKALVAKGFQVDTTEVGFYHNITEIRVKQAD